MPLRYVCPVCEHTIELDDLEVVVDNLFSCEECGAEYVVVSAKPFRCESLEEDADNFDAWDDDEDDKK